MFPNVYLFNPDYDMAMANFTPYYKSPAEIVRMIADLSVLPWWFAEEGSCVKVENMALVSLLKKQLKEVCGGSMGWKEGSMGYCRVQLGRQNGLQLVIFPGGGHLPWCTGSDRKE